MEEERRKAGQDALILELVTGPSEQVGPCIRNALERGWEKGLPGSLADFQQKRGEDIERVCSRYYAEFLGSVQELLTAKSRSTALRQQIIKFNEDIRATGQETLKTGHELQKQKAARRNIAAATVVLNQCRELTSLMVAAKRQIDDGRYYPALATVDNIRQQLSNAYDQPFLHRFRAWLPEVSNEIKAAALRDVGQWLVTIRSQAVAVGKGALRKCNNFMSGLGWEAGSVDVSQATPAHQIAQQMEQIVPFSAWTSESELLPYIAPFLHAPDGEELQVFSALPESLHSLHRALYIHAHLGALDEIRTFYHNNRLPQASIPMSAPAASADEFVTQFQETLFYTTGFFVTEYTMLRSTQYKEGLLSPVKIEDTWATIQRDLCMQVERRAKDLTSPAHFIQLKQSLLLVAFTLGEDCFRFNTAPLLDSIKALKDKFLAVQLQTIEAQCTLILQEEVYQPLSVQSEREYRSLIQPFGIDKRQDATGSEPLLLEEMEPVMVSTAPARRGGGGNATRYPRSFPFSAVVPRVCVELHRMVLLCFLFSLQLNVPYMETAVLKLIDDALKRICKLVDNELTTGLQEDINFPISKACQISIDAAALAKMTIDLEKTVHSSTARFFTTEAVSQVPEMMHRAKREFENMAISAQQLVPELIRRKIDELLGGMCFVEWEASSVINKPRSYVEDIITYLEVTFMCLTYLPKMAREVIHFASCSHISLVLSELLLDPKQVPRINTNGLYNFSVDLAAIENFADSCAVTQLRECFAELRQTLGAMLHPDIDTIMKDANLREGVYPKLNPSKLILILEKYRPLNLLSQVRNQQRQDGTPADLPYLDKKKVTDYLKALKLQGYA